MDNLLFLRFMVTAFGIGASPFLLNMSLQELFARRNANRFIRMARDKFYVDNFVISVKTLLEAIGIHDTLVETLASASFNLRDWKTNDKSVAESLGLPPISPGERVSVLGLLWDLEKDSLFINFEPKETTPNPTKRIVLSFLASIFDPLGLIGPCLLPLKTFMQDCWKIKLDWNDVLPPDFIVKWLKLYHEAKDISCIEIPRRIWKYSEPGGTIRLHVFCDASKDAYACAAYLSYLNSSTGDSTSTLIYSKIRVAPIKKTSVPNLELRAALIGKRSVNFLREQLDITLDRVVLWTDATTVLQWINMSEILPRFVQNRVSEIRRTPNLTINHVPGKQNPADIASRGMSALNLKNSKEWWMGPSWLPHESQWPKPPAYTESHTTPALAVNKSHHGTFLTDSFKKIRSSWDAYVKIIRGLLFVIDKNSRELPSVTSYQTAERKLLLVMQKKYFSQKIAMLKAGIQPEPRLNLFLDDKGLIRCKGRIDNALFPWYTVNPILLPRKSPLTRLLVHKIHSENLHTGCSYTLAKLRERFWIPKGRQFVKAILHRCATCCRVEGGSYQLP